MWLFEVPSPSLNQPPTSVHEKVPAGKPFRIVQSSESLMNAWGAVFTMRSPAHTTGPKTGSVYEAVKCVVFAPLLAAATLGARPARARANTAKTRSMILFIGSLLSLWGKRRVQAGHRPASHRFTAQIL